MKKSPLALVVALSLSSSMPALAGPNWDVIHKAEADKAARKGEPALVLPLDHGPRAITTPWQNQLWLADLIAQTQTRKPVAQAAGKRKGVAVAAHVHADLHSHS